MLLNDLHHMTFLTGDLEMMWVKPGEPFNAGITGPASGR
jgi:hypothetical protein